MKRFLLVDLWSQADAIPASVRALPRAAFLTWLRQFGEVLEWDVALPADMRISSPRLEPRPVGLFRSPYGPEALFELTERGELFLYGDHMRHRAW